MNVKKLGVIVLVFSLATILYGCARAQPNFYNGKYYMAGDDNCKYMRVIGENRIMCSDSRHVDKGWRNAMTDQELQMWMHQQQVNATLMAPQLAPKPVPQQRTSTTCNPNGLGGFNCN